MRAKQKRVVVKVVNFIFLALMYLGVIAFTVLTIDMMLDAIMAVQYDIHN